MLQEEPTTQTKVLENSRSNKVQLLKQFFDLGFEKVVFMT